MKLNMNGFSILELMVVMVISIILVFAGFGLFDIQKQGDSMRAGGISRTDYRLQVEGIRRKMINTLHVRPAMDLAKVGDQKFSGFTNIPPSVTSSALSICRTGSSGSGQFDIFYLSYLDRSKSFAKILRFWGESYLTAQNTDPDYPYRELILNYNTEKNYPFNASSSQKPQYVFIVDADGFRARLYPIKDISNRPTWDINYSTLLQDGKNYPHTALTLDLPKLLSGDTFVVDGKNGFMTDSLVYAAYLRVVCVEDSTGNLIDFDPQSSSEKRTLLWKDTNGFKLSSFEVKFLGTRRDLPLSPDQFYTNYFNAPPISGATSDINPGSNKYGPQVARECANIVKFKLTAEPITKSAGKIPIEVESTIFLTNFMIDRPIACEGKLNY